ncbi:hypothetical protein FQN53_001221 [Emmonsiellopsis sp. PD_33]|nr:hypothetical protein FQN53_001221 [Emmonsiellopsis sp. PD_33]
MTANLEIIDAIRAGDNHSAQLVTVLVKQVSPQNTLPTDTKLPAKIYDPLYYDHEQDDADPFLCVDRDYSQETAVYRSLPNLYGTIIPRYFGSFTLKLPVDIVIFKNLAKVAAIQGRPQQLTQDVLWGLEDFYAEYLMAYLNEAVQFVKDEFDIETSVSMV